MKSPYIIPVVISCLMLAFFQSVDAQHTEYRVMAGMGLFHYKPGGSSSQEPYYSMINFSARNPKSVYANQPRGNNNATSYHFALGLKKVTRLNFLWGLQLGYESRESSKNLNWAYDPDYPSTFLPAKGNAKIRNQMMSFSPMAGYRLLPWGLKLDLLGGIDLMYHIANPHEQSYAIITASGQELKSDLTTSTQAGNDAADLRAHIQAQLILERWGLLVDYTIGIANQDGGAGILGIGTAKSSYSRGLYFGISYRLH